MGMISSVFVFEWQYIRICLRLQSQRFLPTAMWEYHWFSNLSGKRTTRRFSEPVSCRAFLPICTVLLRWDSLWSHLPALFSPRNRLHWNESTCCDRVFWGILWMWTSSPRLNCVIWDAPDVSVASHWADTLWTCCISPHQSPRMSIYRPRNCRNADRRTPISGRVCGVSFIIGKEISFHLAFVKEIIPLIDDGFKTSASDSFRLFRHDSIEVLFPLIFRVGIDVDAQRLMTDYLHTLFVAITGIIIQIERQHVFL